MENREESFETHPIYKEYDDETILQAAKVGHSVMQACDEAFGMPKMTQWECCPEWYKARIISNVEKIIWTASSCRTMHNRWVKAKYHQGWTLGPKDNANQVHPYLVDYNELPIEVRTKLKMFRAAVMPFRKNLGPHYLKPGNKAE